MRFRRSQYSLRTSLCRSCSLTGKTWCWSTTTRTMWAEAQQDRVFEESLFWVQTRAMECNYCMGHCEMLLEVAGLNREQVRERLQCLASDDWSAFAEACT